MERMDNKSPMRVTVDGGREAAAVGGEGNGIGAAVEAGFAKMKIETARRHVFLCPGPNCCAREAGLATWEALKAGCKADGVDALRTKAECLRVCAGGPWMVVYPDGTWYGGVTPERCERIVRQHVKGGQPVTEWVERTQTLSGGGYAAPAGPTSSH
jgi:(2Fe-2S) ferredoxin